MRVGSIHKNSKTRYFAVGGYFCFEEDRIKIKAKYKRENLKLKKAKKIDLDLEIKSYNMTEEEKIQIFNKIQDYDDDFEITYYDSKNNYAIQLADLTVNTFYNSYKDMSIVENVIKELKPKNFIVSLFPRNSSNKK